MAETGVAQAARELKNLAMDARDDGDWAKAHDLLGQADRILVAALDNLDRHPDPAQAEDTYKLNLLAQIGHIKGSTGGVCSRQQEYDKSALAYDAGNDYERKLDSTDKPNSYNLVQRLVARALLAPAAVELDSATVLNENLNEALQTAYSEIQRQIEKYRSKDAYAQADAFMVLLLLNDPQWPMELEKFIKHKNLDRYALEVTLDVTDRLLARAAEERVDSFQSRLAAAAAILRDALRIMLGSA